MSPRRGGCYAAGELEGFLRLSLVSCPIYLSPATTRTKSIRLHQLWQPKAAAGAPIEDDEEEERPSRPARRSVTEDARSDVEAEPSSPTRIALHPHDPHTGEEIERDEVVKGYEYERGRFVTFTPAELKALDVESSKIIDLETFVPRVEVDPIYFSTPYYVYPDGPIADETFGVIGAAMREAHAVGIGRVALSRRERQVMVEPRDGGLVAITLRALDEVRAPSFATGETDIDGAMAAVATMIMKRRRGHFDPTTFRDRYQEALRELIEAKMKGISVKPIEITAPQPIHDLMAALKRSLAQDADTVAKPRRKAAGDRRQTSLLLPVSGKKEKGKPATAPATALPRRRKA